MIYLICMSNLDDLSDVSDLDHDLSDLTDIDDLSDLSDIDHDLSNLPVHKRTSNSKFKSFVLDT